MEGKDERYQPTKIVTHSKKNAKNRVESPFEAGNIAGGLKPKASVNGGKRESAQNTDSKQSKRQESRQTTEYQIQKADAGNHWDDHEAAFVHKDLSNQFSKIPDVTPFDKLEQEAIKNGKSREIKFTTSSKSNSQSLHKSDQSPGPGAYQPSRTRNDDLLLSKELGIINPEHLTRSKVVDDNPGPGQYSNSLNNRTELSLSKELGIIHPPHLQKDARKSDDLGPGTYEVSKTNYNENTFS